MKRICLIICLSLFLLNGCTKVPTLSSSSTPILDDIKLTEQHQYFTTNKTMMKAFKAYELLGESDCDDYLVNGCDYDVVRATRDFYTRMCDTEYFAKNIKDELGIEMLNKIKTVQFLANSDNELLLSNKDMYCLSLKCDYYPVYDHDTQRNYGKLNHDGWLHDDDECIERRDIILADTNITMRCTFEYSDYVPGYAKIGTHDSFIKLYKAYKTDIIECNNKRETSEIISKEYDECIKSVEDKVEKIVKSGVLK